MKCVIVLAAVVAVGQCLFLNDKLPSTEDVFKDILSSSVSNTKLRTRSITKRRDYYAVVNAFFYLVDDDRDGQITVLEYAHHAIASDWNAKLEIARTKILEIDTDGDYQINKTELLNYALNRYGRK